jgi:tRNA pseudouridine38/39 synthase
MQRAAALLVGEHNFQNFCKMNLCNTTQHVRRVISAHLEQVPLTFQGRGDLLVFHIRGSSFLWHQARSPLSALSVRLRTVLPATCSYRCADASKHW